MTRPEPPDGLTDFATMLWQAEHLGHDREPSSREELARRKRRRRIAGLVSLIAAFVIVALLGTYVAFSLTAPIGAAAAVVHRPDVQAPPAATIALPTIGEAAVSVSGADDYLGPKASGIFASSGGNAPLPMASISKIITAMVVLDAKPLGASGTGPTLTFSKADAALYDKYYLLDATIAAMPSGSRMSEHDAIETMLVVSACNYAEAIADWAFGSNAGFVKATKTWLAAHGLSGTTLVEPTGLDPRNAGTPSDLIAVGKLAMADPALASIVAKTSLDVPSLLGMPNTNDLLGVDGVNGIKTGTLDDDNSELLFSAVVPVGTDKPLNIIGVMLGGESRSSVDAAVQALIASITQGFHTVSLADEGQTVGSYSTPWGSKATMVLGDSASVFTWSNTPITSTMTTTTLKTGATGEKVGSVTWTAGKTKVTVPVVLKGTIKPPTAWWRLTHPSEVLGW